MKRLLLLASLGFVCFVAGSCPKVAHPKLGADFNDHVAEATVASLNSGITKLTHEGHHPTHTELLVKMLKRRGAALCQCVDARKA